MEDEIHHVLFCDRFIDIRHILTEACCETYSAFNEMTTNDKFEFIVNSDCKKLLTKFGDYLVQANSL